MVVAVLYSAVDLYSGPFYLPVGLASAVVDFDPDFVDPAVGLSAFSEPKLSYNAFHHPLDYCAVTVCMLLPP